MRGNTLAEDVAKSLSKDEFGDNDFDAATYEYRITPNQRFAEQMAASGASVSPLGYALITPVELVDPFEDGIPSTYLWEPCGDSWEVRLE